MTAIRITLLLSALLLIPLAVSLLCGDPVLSPPELFQLLTYDNDANGAIANLFWNIRLPRIVMGIVVGAGLAAAGAGFQGLFRNPLADPYIIGASSGASLGIAIAALQGWQFSLLGIDPVSVLGMTGSLLTVMTVYLIATVGGRTPTVGLLLAGVAVSSFVGAVVTLMMFLHDDHLALIFGSLQSSVAGGGWQAVAAVTPLTLLGIVAMCLLARPLDVLTFGDESAAGLGISVAKLRIAVVVIASFLTALAVAGGGVIGFVGLIGPHTARLIVGPRHGRLIPASCLIGSGLLLVADVVARMAWRPTELPVGIVCALLGGPFFIYLLKSRYRTLGGGP